MALPVSRCIGRNSLYNLGGKAYWDKLQEAKKQQDLVDSMNAANAAAAPVAPPKAVQAPPPPLTSLATEAPPPPTFDPVMLDNMRQTVPEARMLMRTVVNPEWVAKQVITGLGLLERIAGTLEALNKSVAATAAELQRLNTPIAQRYTPTTHGGERPHSNPKENAAVATLEQPSPQKIRVDVIGLLPAQANYVRDEVQKMYTGFRVRFLETPKALSATTVAPQTILVTGFVNHSIQEKFARLGSKIIYCNGTNREVIIKLREIEAKFFADNPDLAPRHFETTATVTKTETPPPAGK
jgi:hypothetical protein